MALILCFFWRIRNGRVEPLAEPRNVSNTTMIVSGALSIGVSMSFCYTMVHDLVFKNCDEIVEVDSTDNWAIDQYEVYTFLLLLFSGLLAYYLRQRMYFPSDFDWVDFVTIKITSSLLVVLWIGELIDESHAARNILFPKVLQISAQNNATEYIPPCIKQSHTFKCHPEEEFPKNSSKYLWYHLDRYLIHQVVESLACEYYPVILVVHWVVTGRADTIVKRIIQRKEIIVCLRSTGKRQLDPHHLGEAKADMRLLLGSAVFMTFGWLCRIVDGFVRKEINIKMILKLFRQIAIHLQCWPQYFILRKMAGFGRPALTRHQNILPCIILAAVFINFTNFWILFLRAWVLDYHVSKMSKTTDEISPFVRLLLSQVVIPFNLLFYFTSCSMWSEIAVRYSKLGAYRLDKSHIELENGKIE